MITMPHTFPMRGKSILNGNGSSNQEIHTFSLQTGYAQTNSVPENLHSLASSDSSHVALSVASSAPNTSIGIGTNRHSGLSRLPLVASKAPVSGQTKPNNNVSKKARSKTKPVKIVTTPPVANQEHLEPPIGNGPFRCVVCSKEFLKYALFKRHKNEHLDEKAFRCRLCSMSFNFEENFNLHKMLHEAEKDGNLQCKVCPAKFSRFASLKSHLRIHEKNENLVCQECGDEFSTQLRLDAHTGM